MSTNGIVDSAVLNSLPPRTARRSTVVWQPADQPSTSTAGDKSCTRCNCEDELQVGTLARHDRGLALHFLVISQPFASAAQLGALLVKQCGENGGPIALSRYM
jgi:hypothetical protein